MDQGHGEGGVSRTHRSCGLKKAHCIDADDVSPNVRYFFWQCLYRLRTIILSALKLLFLLIFSIRRLQIQPSINQPHYYGFFIFTRFPFSPALLESLWRLQWLFFCISKISGTRDLTNDNDSWYSFMKVFIFFFPGVSIDLYPFPFSYRVWIATALSGVSFGVTRFTLFIALLLSSLVSYSCTPCAFLILCCAPSTVLQLIIS